MRDYALQKTISLVGSISQLAKKLGVPRVTVSAWLHRNNIPLEHAIQMERITNGEVTWQELVTPNIVRILKRCPFTLHNSGIEVESVFLSLARIKQHTHANFSNETINLLAENIKQHGLLNPICVDADNNLIFGAKRFKAYELLGKKTIQVLRLSLHGLLEGKYTTQLIIDTFTIEERSHIGIALEKLLGARQGRNNPKNFPEFKGKETREIVAMRLGYRNAKTYEQAKKITLAGNPELIKAVSQKQISISAAFTLLKLSHQAQNNILTLDSKKIVCLSSQLRKQKILPDLQSIGVI